MWEKYSSTCKRGHYYGQQLGTQIVPITQIVTNGGYENPLKRKKLRTEQM